jgi:hypothetical protein
MYSHLPLAWQNLPLQPLLHRGLAFIWLLLAFFHVPLGGGAAGDDAVGVYDLVCATLLAFFVFRELLKPSTLLGSGREFMVLYGLWLLTMALSMLLNLDNVSSFSLLLFAKQLQFLAGIWLTWKIFHGLPLRTAHRLLDAAMLLLLAGGYYFFFTQWWALPLPFHFGSGAVMGAIVFLYMLWVVQTKSLTSLFTLGWLGFLLISGFLTMGRTQVLAFAVAMLALVISQVLVSTSSKRLMALLMGMGAVCLVFYIVFYTDILGVTFYGGSPLQYLTLEKTASDPSFGIRLNIIWPEVLRDWASQGTAAFWFGVGLGKHRYVDGLFINLLTATGIFGCLAFLLLSLWLWMRLPRFRIALIFLAVSSLTGELVLQSYRFHQFLMVIGVFFYLYTPPGKLAQMPARSLENTVPVAA